MKKWHTSIYGDSQFDIQFFQILNPYKKSQSFWLKKLVKIIPLVFLSSCTTSSKCYFEQLDLNLPILIGVFL
jgi:hypothetical protein